ncbi:MAG: aminotransferase class IV [Candidatus Binatia bacterium]
MPAASFVQVNGRSVPAARARVSVFDRGLLYGDGLFETLRAYHGKAFALEDHLARLARSADFLGIPVPPRPWQRDIEALLRRNRLLCTDAWVRITITRGVAAPGLRPPSRIRPTVIVSAGKVDPSVAKVQQRGARVALLPFARHGFLAEHKVLNYLPGVLGKVMAARHDAFEGVFVDGRGWVTEGTTSNIFIARRKQLFTPPGSEILPGLTRRTVIELAVANGLRVSERPLRVDALLDASEAFLTSSLAEIVPIIAVNTHEIGLGRIGPTTRQLQHLYRQMVDQVLAHR